MVCGGNLFRFIQKFNTGGWLAGQFLTINNEPLPFLNNEWKGWEIKLSFKNCTKIIENNFDPVLTR